MSLSYSTHDVVFKVITTRTVGHHQILIPTTRITDVILPPAISLPSPTRVGHRRLMAAQVTRPGWVSPPTPRPPPPPVQPTPCEAQCECEHGRQTVSANNDNNYNTYNTILMIIILLCSRKTLCSLQCICLHCAVSYTYDRSVDNRHKRLRGGPCQPVSQCPPCPPAAPAPLI
jgi:hypothetical protein